LPLTTACAVKSGAFLPTKTAMCICIYRNSVAPNYC
jgi:hypothetical protein